MCPSDEDLSNAIENNVIGSNSFTCQDVVNANKLFGSDIAALKGNQEEEQATKRGCFY